MTREVDVDLVQHGVRFQPCSNQRDGGSEVQTTQHDGDQRSEWPIVELRNCFEFVPERYQGATPATLRLILRSPPRRRNVEHCAAHIAPKRFGIS